jgi:hypothetical protein
MPLRLFSRETSSAAKREREEKIERALADGFRFLAELLRKSADAIEAQRLARNGYEKQEKFLERAKPGSPQDKR